MVLTTLADITLDVTIWSVKKVYGVGYWLIWGTPKTETEILLEQQSKTIEMLHEDLVRINERLSRIEEENHHSQENKNDKSPIVNTEQPVEIFNMDAAQEFEIIEPIK